MAFTIKAMSIGEIAKKYNVDYRVMWNYIKAHDNLEKAIEPYTKNHVHKGNVKLPPIVVQQFVDTLKEP